MNRSILPKDSLVHRWVDLLSPTEIPMSWQILSGMSVLGILLRRNAWIDQHSTEGWGWNVWPNQSLMLIGPSGCGKDTTTNYVCRCLGDIHKELILGGRTIEQLYARLMGVGDPAVAYVPIPEMAAFFGSKDYQGGLIQEFTDLLSSNERKDITTKGDLFMGGQPKYIPHPTLTVHCGSTEEWLHKAMPDGTLEGGFIGRFLVLVEGQPAKQVPFIADAAAEHGTNLDHSSRVWADFLHRVDGLRVGKMLLFEEAKHAYTNWYWNRFKRFSRAVLPYANRSRDTVLRLAMLCAISREHFGWIDGGDMEFGIAVLDDVARRIDEVVLPPTLESRAAEEILRLLPTTGAKILQILGRKYPMKILETAEQLLVRRGDMHKEGEKWTRRITN